MEISMVQQLAVIMHRSDKKIIASRHVFDLFEGNFFVPFSVFIEQCKDRRRVTGNRESDRWRDNMQHRATGQIQTLGHYVEDTASVHGAPVPKHVEETQDWICKRLTLTGTALFVTKLE